MTDVLKTSELKRQDIQVKTYNKQNLNELHKTGSLLGVKQKAEKTTVIHPAMRSVSPT